MITRAFSSLGCAELPLEDMLALALRHRLDAVELRALDDSIDLPAALARLHGSPAALAARMAKSPVRICSLDTSFRLSDSGPADRDKLLLHVPWAEALGVRYLRVFDGPGLLEKEASDRALAALAWWRDLRSSQGWRVDLMIETHDTLLRSGDILRFLDRAPSGTALLWDSHHTWRLGGEDPCATWRAIGSRVVHIHVKDSVSTPGSGERYAYVPCGQGEFPMPALRSALAADDWSGVLSLEWERKWLPALPPLAEALSSADARAWW